MSRKKQPKRFYKKCYFDHRAKHIRDWKKGTGFLFRVNIIAIETSSKEWEYQCKMYNAELSEIAQINLNGWVLNSIKALPYYSRHKIYFEYADPKGGTYKMESVGLTLRKEHRGGGIETLVHLFTLLLSHFYNISHFESIEQVKKRIEYLLSNKRNKEVGDISLAGLTW